MYIAVDAMGGDHAPREVVAGACRVAAEHGVRSLLVGDEERVAAELRRCGGGEGLIEIVHAEEVVGMDEPPITPIRRKRRSSVRVCAELVKEGRARAMVTAGNTGAAMISAKMVVGTVPGVDRPALAVEFPNREGRTLVLDAGANVGTKPSHLREFAVMGHLYALEVGHTPSPRIGLMSIGEEDTKGTEVTRRVFQVLQETGLNFVGNVEGQDVFNGSVDVIVCDGFVGNVLLKSAEAVAGLIKEMLREELDKSLRLQLGALLARPAFERLSRRTDYREYGAGPLLGLKGGCFIAHGRSNATAIMNSIRRAAEFAEAGVAEKIRDRLVLLHSEEERLLGTGGDAGPRGEG